MTQSLGVRNWRLGVVDEKTVGDEKIEHPANFEFGSENLAEILIDMSLSFQDTWQCGALAHHTAYI